MATFADRSLPDGPRGRMMALGVTLLGAVLVWLGLVQPLLDAYATRADALRQRAVLADRMADLVSTLPVLRKQAAALAKAGPPANTTIGGATDAIATASLQSLLESMAGTAGVHVTSAEALPADQQGDYRRVALRLSVDATWPTLVAMLQAIARATPRMFVDELQLHAQPTSDKMRELPLDISFTVLAFRAPGPPAAVSAAASAGAAPGQDVAPANAGAAPGPDVAPTPTPSDADPAKPDAGAALMRPALVLLGGSATTLILVIAAEVVVPAASGDVLAEATGVRPAVRLPALDPARDAAPAEDRTDAWVATILARPLFTRDRRPVSEHATASASGPQSLPRLTGIAVSPFGRSAIFAAETGKPLVVSEGGSVAGFTVRAIHPGAVDIEGPAGQRTLAPAFDPNPPKPEAAPAVETDSQVPGVPQPGFPQPGFPQPGVRGLPQPQFRVPGQPMLPPGLRPRLNNGAALQPAPFDRLVMTARADQGQPKAAT